MPISDTNQIITYGLTEVAELNRRSPSYIANIITRYDVVKPSRYADTGIRKTYQFTQEEASTIQQITALTDLGRPPREAAEMIKDNTAYKAAAQAFSNSILDWLSTSDPESWVDLVEAISSIPTLSDIERTILVDTQGLQKSIPECRVELNLKTDNEVIQHLESAYKKIGRQILYVLAQTKHLSNSTP